MISANTSPAGDGPGGLHRHGRAMQQECDQLIEVGPGRVLSGLVADINEENGLLPAGRGTAGRGSRPEYRARSGLHPGRGRESGRPCTRVDWYGHSCRRKSDSSSTIRANVLSPNCRPSRCPLLRPGALESFLVESTGYEPAQMQDISPGGRASWPMSFRRTFTPSMAVC